MHRVAVRVGEHLDLDVPRRGQVLLDQHAVVAEGGLRLASGRGERRLEASLEGSWDAAAEHRQRSGVELDRGPGRPPEILPYRWTMPIVRKDEGLEIRDLVRSGDDVIATRGAGDSWIILGAHYDSRLRSDYDPDPEKQTTPVPGANDGASGVAVLLELARVLPVETGHEIWLVFFDAEDNGRIDDWDWILGSRAFAASLQAKPDAVIIVDMVGDADLQLPLEQNSDPVLSQQIWQIAAKLGYAQFIPEYKYSILDDHIPFIELGIPAVDIIDIDYAYYHTTQDTPDKVSAQSLHAVGDTLLKWLLNSPVTDLVP